jgi:hypothetical protein
MYVSERERAIAEDFGGEFDAVAAGETFGRYLAGGTTDHLLELRHEDRKRIFDLGYFTWVEQQGVPIEDFTARAEPSFWNELDRIVPVWDGMIDEFNGRTGVLERL